MFLKYITLCLLLAIYVDSQSTCIINLQNTTTRTPIILKNFKIVNAENSCGNVTVKHNDQVQLLCSGSGNYLEPFENRQFFNATCNNALYEVSGYQFKHFTDFLCKIQPQPSAQRVGTCNGNSLKIEIGFQINLGQFIPKIEVCFDKSQSLTYWTRHELNFSPYRCQHRGSTSFRKDFYKYTNDPSISYDNQTQYETGHLTPKCDFFTDAEHKMTYYYINSAPQQKKFNRGNWRSLEIAIRKKINQVREPAEILTGTYSPHGYNHTMGYLRVPLVFWKIVLYKGSGIVFIGANDFERDVLPELKCKCNETDWLSDNLKKLLKFTHKGKVICVEIETLQKMTDLPNLSYNGHFLSSFN